MEAVAFEKKQLLSQWRSSLAAMQRRDTALEVGWGRGHELEWGARLY